MHVHAQNFGPLRSMTTYTNILLWPVFRWASDHVGVQSDPSLCFKHPDEFVYFSNFH